MPTLGPDDALAQPTRARLFALLERLKRPAATDELAERVGLHANGVRLHLERLHAAGLLTRTRVRQPVGRPRDEWAIASDARPGGDPPSAYSDLGRWLARAIEPTKIRLRDVEARGVQIGREIAPRDSQAPASEVMHTALAAMGFAPQTETLPGRQAVFCLGNCPYQQAASENQAVVCTLHRGITRGLLEVVAPTAQLADFVARDPNRGGCLITVDGLSRATTR